MSELLPLLICRGVTGRASECDQKILEFLAWGSIVNQRIFGQPLPGVLLYYGREHRAHVLGCEAAGGTRSAGSR
jgi:hypothetical protein